MTRRILIALALLACLFLLLVVPLGLMARPAILPFRVGYWDPGLGFDDPRKLRSCVFVRLDYPGPYVRPWIWIHKPTYWLSFGIYEGIPSRPLRPWRPVWAGPVIGIHPSPRRPIPSPSAKIVNLTGKDGHPMPRHVTPRRVMRARAALYPVLLLSLPPSIRRMHATYRCRFVPSHPPIFLVQRRDTGRVVLPVCFSADLKQWKELFRVCW